MDDKRLEEILDDAIQREQMAHDFYLDLAQRVDRPEMRAVLRQFAAEELGHQAKLQGVKEGKRPLISGATKVLDLRITDYLVEVDPQADLSYQNALILAMKREKASFRLYQDLAAQADQPELKELFLGLAQEEAKHKLRFEVEYDEIILAEN